MLRPTRNGSISAEGRSFILVDSAYLTIAFELWRLRGPVQVEDLT